MGVAMGCGETRVDTAMGWADTLVGVALDETTPPKLDRPLSLIRSVVTFPWELMRAWLAVKGAWLAVEGAGEEPETPDIARWFNIAE